MWDSIKKGYYMFYSFIWVDFQYDYNLFIKKCNKTYCIEKLIKLLIFTYYILLILILMFIVVV
jgi:hypothetical protein